MQYMMLPLDRHFDLGFGAVADSFKDAADTLSSSGAEAQNMHGHLPISFLYRHAIELFFKSAIVIFHRKFNLPFGEISGNDEPRVLIDGKWKPMYNVHAVLPLYSYFCVLFANHSEYLKENMSTDWTFPAEFSDWIEKIEATDSSSTFFRYPVTRHGERDKEKSAIRRDSYDNMMSSLAGRKTPLKAFLVVDQNDQVVEAFQFENADLKTMISTLSKAAQLLSDCHAALVGELTGGA
jgi:hypothetical protein